MTVSNYNFVSKVNNSTLESRALIIASNAVHQFEADPRQVVLIVNLNPWSLPGLWCKSQLANRAFVDFSEDFAALMWQNANDLSEQTQSVDDFEKWLTTQVKICYADADFSMEPRIEECLKLLRKKPMTSAKNMASELAVSESRFLHLFKEETGLTYRRMSLWFRLEKSFRHYKEFTSLTALAYHCGFSDSAHYSRTFKQTFGTSPSEILRK